MKCEDISTAEVCRIISLTQQREKRWANLSEIAAAFPGCPPKLLLAKLRQMVKRYYLNGCPCGCRGDFDLLSKGKQLLESNS